MVGEIAAFTLTLTNDTIPSTSNPLAGALADNTTLAVNQNFRLLVQLEDTRPNSHFATLLAEFPQLTISDVKGFFDASLDVNFNPSFIQSRVTDPTQLNFGPTFQGGLAGGTISNPSGVLDNIYEFANFTVRNTDANDADLNNLGPLIFFSAPFKVAHAPATSGQNDFASTARNVPVDIPVLANDTLDRVVSFTGSMGAQGVTIRFNLDPNLPPNQQFETLDELSEVSFTSDSLKIQARNQIKASTLPAGVTLKNIGNDSDPTNDVLTFTPPNGFTGQHVFSYELQNADDPTGPTQLVTVTVNVIGPPTLSAVTGSPVNINENSGQHTLSLSNILPGVGGSQNLDLLVTSSGPAGLLTNIATNYTAPNTTGSVTFSTGNNAFGQGSITVQVRDRGTNLASTSDDILGEQRTFIINVADVNSGPTVTVASPGTLSFTENGAAIAVGAGVTITDDGANLSGAKVTISTAGGQLAEDLLAFTLPPAVPGIVATTVTNSSITFTGTASLAAYQTLLQSVTYRNTSENPSTAQRTITFEATDTGNALGVGPLTRTATRLVNVVAQNDAPILGGNASVRATSVSGLPVAIAPDITLTDLDNGLFISAKVQFSAGFDVNVDELVFPSPQGGINGSFNPTTGELTFNGLATLANYENALRSVKFQTNSTSLVTRQISISVNDGSTIVTQNRAVDITPPNLAPALASTLTKIPKYTENSKSFKVIDTKFKITDSDGTSIVGATVQIVDFRPGDELRFKAKGSITGNYDPQTGLLALTGSASETFKNWETVLKSVGFRAPTNDNPGPTRTFRFTVNDGSAVNGTGSIDRTLNITQKNDKPVFALPKTATAAVSVRQNVPVPIDPTLQLSDADSATLTKVTVKISGYKKDQDRLAFTNTANITGTFDQAKGTLTLTGAATPAEYEAAVRLVTYVNTSATPKAGTRTFKFTAEDGGTPNGKGVVTRKLAVTSSGQNLVGAHVVVAPTGVTQSFVFGTGWAGFTNGSANITFGAGGVPQSAQIQVTDPINVVRTATIALTGNPNVLVTGSQATGVTFEIFGGSNSVTFTPPIIAEGESAFLVQATGDPTPANPSPVRASTKKSSGASRLPVDLNDLPSGEQLDEVPSSASSDEALDEQRRREAAEYAASVDALLAAAWGSAG